MRKHQRLGLRKNFKKEIGIIGVGYVGLPLAVNLSKFFNVTAFDKDKNVGIFIIIITKRVAHTILSKNIINKNLDSISEVLKFFFCLIKAIKNPTRNVPPNPYMPYIPKLSRT